MTSFATASQAYILVIETLTGVGIGYVYIRSRIPKQTIVELQDLADAQGKRLKFLEDETRACATNHHDSLQEIASLKGQIEVIKQIPLTNIDKALSSIAETNDMILKTLLTTARINAEDRSTLIGHVPEQHISTQTVDTQVVKKGERS